MLGIDPGYATTGYGIITTEKNHPSALGWGCITTSKKDGDALIRLEKIFNGITGILEEYCPVDMAIEKLFFSRNTTSALQVSEARGVILLAAARQKIPVTEYTPNQVKLAVTGSGAADKRQVQDMTARLLRLPEIVRPDDAADGLALALCHMHTRRGRG